MTTAHKLLICSVFALCLNLVWQNNVIAQEDISIVVEDNLSGCALYGIDKIISSLETNRYSVVKVPSLEMAKGNHIIVTGVSSANSQASQMLKASNIPVPDGLEALVIHQTSLREKPVLILCGSDERGLMYAALDVAERIGWSQEPKQPFSNVKDIEEKPDALQRAISMYTMHRAYFESRLYNKDYWESYFDLLAKNRFNSFVIIFGYENGGFMAPLYPYFFDVEKFPDVRLVGITVKQQEKNISALKQLIAAAHQRGIDVTIGIWDHIYRGGVQGGGIPGADRTPDKPTPGLVWGVTTDNLSSYNKAAIKKFIQTFPELDAIQFRMHWESGLRREETRDFWKEIFSMISEMRPDMNIDARAKGLPDEVIDDALSLGVDLRITTKYWMEQMGLPFHPTHINTENQRDRRHGYADLLKYPQRYKMHWRLWTGGTSRILLWGDPDYVKTFVESTHLYNAYTFEVQEPLATKMLGQPHDMKPFELLNADYRYYDWEFERYWHFYQVFGRLGYNPNTDPEIWQHEFQSRFGSVAPNIEKGLHLASKVLPRIVASCNLYRYFPTTRGWIEKMRMKDLPEFATAEGSDIQQFANFREEAENIIKGIETPKLRPMQNSQWFAQISKDILQEVAEAEKQIGSSEDKEFISTVTDLRILANLAMYYSRRIPAAVSYNLFNRTNDVFALDDAIKYEQDAIDAWEEIVQAAGDVYTDNIMMGVRELDFCGHWKDELLALQQGLDQLKKKRIALNLLAEDENFRISHVPLRKHLKNESLVFRATVSSKEPVSYMRVAVLQENGSYQYQDLQSVNQYQYQTALSSSLGQDRLSYFLEAKDINGKIVTFPQDGQENPMVVILSADNEPPELTFTPVTKAKPLQPLKVTVKASDPSGIKLIRLRYRHVTQFEDYMTMEMKPEDQTGVYSAEIPGDFITTQWDIMYFIEVMDKANNGQMYPSFEKGIPYTIVSLER